MSAAIYLVLGAVAWLWGFWLLYVLFMGLYRAYLAGRLTGINLTMALPVVVVGLLVDIITNWTLAWLIFLDAPQEKYVTGRLKRYIAGPEGWRKDIALWVCNGRLDFFDPKGEHC